MPEPASASVAVGYGSCSVSCCVKGSALAVFGTSVVIGVTAIAVTGIVCYTVVKKHDR